MKDKKRKYILMIILLGVLMLLSGCVRKECDEKVKDLEFTVTKDCCLASRGAASQAHEV